MYIRKLIVLFTFLAVLAVSNLSAVQARPNALVTLPVGETTYKITLAADGIYEITADDLLAAGMEIATVDPAMIEMMQRGETVSYQFIGDDDAIFEPGERIRFYGWQFDGMKHEKRYVGDTNIFWLWANGSASAVPTVDNPTGYTQVITAPVELIFEEENYFTLPRAYEWDQYENEPDNWYWERYSYHFNDTTIEYSGREIFFPSKNYEIEIPYPADTAEPARFTAEFQTPFRGTYAITTTLAESSASETWHFWKTATAYPSDPFSELPQLRNNHIHGTVPNNALSDGMNLFNISGESTELNGRQYYNGEGKVHFNRIMVNYTRDLVTDNDQLIFNGAGAGAHEYLVSGFSDTATSAIVWNLNNKHNPQVIELTASDIQDGGTWRIAADHSESAQIIATTEASIQRPDTIEAYTAAPIEPQEGAEWLAISHRDFIPAINTLAEYRQEPTILDADGFTTHVVDLDHVINQYGYGFFMPEGIKEYLRHTLLDWTIPPDYVVLGGDASWNPLNRECIPDFCPEWWEVDVNDHYLPVDFEFSNLEVGMFITDYTYSTLLGDDLTAEFAIGRFPAQTLEEMEVMVDKTILYDQRMLNSENTHRFVLPSDDEDDAGNFCEGNDELSRLHIPDYYNKIEICLDHIKESLDVADFSSESELKQEAKMLWREAVFAEVDAGVDLLNYRGHGYVNFWQGKLVIEAGAHAPQINNVGKPAVFISHDCLDADFSRSLPSLAETFLKLPDRGTAAHLGATSLGYNWQHMITQRGFYNGLFSEGKTRLGDAMLSGTNTYLDYERRDEFRTFVAETMLLGDPALLLRNVETLSVSVSTQSSSTASGDLLMPTALLAVATIAVSGRFTYSKRRF